MIAGRSANELLFRYAETREAIELGNMKQVDCAAGVGWSILNPPRFAHFLVSGMFSRRIKEEAGNTVSINSSFAGEVLELQECFASHNHVCTAVALLPSRVVRVPFESLQRAMLENADFALTMAYAAGQLCVRAEQISACRAHHSLEARVASYLLQFEPIRKAFPSNSQETLATELGASSYAVTFILEDLQRRGLLRRDSDQICIPNPDLFGKIACSCRIYREEGRPVRVSSRGLPREMSIPHQRTMTQRMR